MPSIRYELLEALDAFVLMFCKVNGAKTLVLDPTVAGPLGLLTEVSLLKVGMRCGFQRFSMLNRIFIATRSRQDVLAGVRSARGNDDEHCVLDSRED